tara:strand:+ start:451 stop:654 length:204 start_codon:yes stop_codon:yes gene_type:complete
MQQKRFSPSQLVLSFVSFFSVPLLDQSIAIGNGIAQLEPMLSLASHSVNGNSNLTKRQLIKLSIREK